MIRFLKEYIKNPREIGAVAPSSNELAKNIIKGVDFDNSRCIVEYGPGTGVFTKKIVEKANKDTIVLLLENNKRFADELSRKYRFKNNVIVINDSAENIDSYLNKYKIDKVDYVISGLPFTSLPRETSEAILRKTSHIISDNGEFRTFQYSLIKKNFIARYFDNMEHCRVIMNIPSAYILKCRNVDM